MPSSYESALINLSQNVKTLSAQVAQGITQQQATQLTAAINTQFGNINNTLTAVQANIQTLFAYTTAFPVPAFADGEIPAGAINGINPTFTLANNPTIGSVQIFIGTTATSYGMLALQSTHYIVIGNQITFQAGFIPVIGSWIKAYYRYQGQQ